MTATEEQLQEPNDTTDTNIPAVASGPIIEPHVTRPAPAELTANTPSAVHTPFEQSTPDAQNSNNNNPLTRGPVDPEVSALLNIFPDFDVAVLQSILQSVSGDQDKAIDVLLGMSDPEYKITARPDVTQTQLDEAMARQLMLEETEQQQQAWRPQEASPRTPYEQHDPASQQVYRNSQQRPADNDGMAQFQEQLGKFAETGKKTFSTLFSKVKAKIQEFDNHSGQGQSSHPLPRGDAWNTPAQAQSYYDPNPSGFTDGYDVTARGTEPSSHGELMTREGTASTIQPINTAQVVTTSTTTPTGIDPSKIGLLPKQPVSLGSSPQPSKSLDDDDDVEYMENPFEESAKR